MERASGTDREPWILALDVGSSSARAWLYDRGGRGLDPGPGASRRYVWRSDPPGTMEQDPGTLLRGVAEAVDAALAHAREAGLEIAAVAVASFWHSLLVLDAAGQPLSAVIAWGDTRAAGEALRLREEVDEAALHRRTGCFLHPGYPLVRLRWLRRADPELSARAAAWVSFAEYLEERFFGRRRCSYSMASGTGLLDVHRLEWDAEALAIAGVEAEALSPLVDADEPLRGLLPGFAARWPELAEVPWFPALGDGACANLGSGAVGAGRIGVTVGTSAAARALWEPAGAVEVPEELWCYRLDRRWWVAGGALSNGGNGPAFLRGLLDLPPAHELEARLEAMEPDAHGLTVLPFLVGERGPGWLRETRSAVLGMRPATEPEEVLRAWMEASAYRIAAVCERLDGVLGAEAEVTASGGALHASPAWVRILADVLGRRVSLPAEREATARGAAQVARAALGWLPRLDDAALAEGAADVEPRPEAHRRYRAARERQRALADALAPWMSRASPGREAPRGP